MDVSQSIPVQAKLLHVFSEVGGTHNIGILCLNSPEKYLDEVLATPALGRIPRKNATFAERKATVIDSPILSLASSAAPPI